MRQFISTKAAAVMAAAGLVSTAAAVAITSAPTAAAGSFGSPVVVTRQSVSEPGVDVASDGTIYVNGPAGLLSNLPGSPSYVFRSTDGGASFQETPADMRALFPGGGDSDIAIDPANGKLFMTGYRRGYKGRCGRDANGWKLFARTATRCAYSGKDFMDILRIYYGPDLTIRR